MTTAASAAPRGSAAARTAALNRLPKAPDGDVSGTAVSAADPIPSRPIGQAFPPESGPVVVVPGLAAIDPNFVAPGVVDRSAASRGVDVLCAPTQTALKSIFTGLGSGGVKQLCSSRARSSV